MHATHAAPKVPCPVATTFLSVWEAELGAPERRRLVDPLRARLPHTRTGADAALHKGALAIDWLVHTCAPAWLELAGPDPVALASLRCCPTLRSGETVRVSRIAVDQAIRSVLAARMAVCNTAWTRSRPRLTEDREMAERVVSRTLPGVIDFALGRTGFHAALEAAGRAPFTRRWPVLRDHLLGLAHAAASAVTWQATWGTLAAGAAGEDAWVEACRRPLQYELLPLAERLQPHAMSLGLRILET